MRRRARRGERLKDGFESGWTPDGDRMSRPITTSSRTQNSAKASLFHGSASALRRSDAIAFPFGMSIAGTQSERRKNRTKKEKTENLKLLLRCIPSLSGRAIYVGSAIVGMKVIEIHISPMLL
jgi:hypothetical protein